MAAGTPGRRNVKHQLRMYLRMKSESQLSTLGSTSMVNLIQRSEFDKVKN
jgi:hypothetical protein